MISTVLFDLDDLLSDTERLHCRAYQTILRQHGCELSDDQYFDHWTRQGLGIADWLQSHGLRLDAASLQRAKAVEYKALVKTSCQPMPGALELAVVPSFAVPERAADRRKLSISKLDWIPKQELGIVHLSKSPSPAASALLEQLRVATGPA